MSAGVLAASPELLANLGTYVIRELDGSFVRRAPTVGQWYCGFEANEQYENAIGFIGPNGKYGWMDGAIAEYDADGGFYDENGERDFGRYDWLAVQS